MPSSSSLRAARLEPHFTGNTLLTSTPAHPPSSGPTLFNRSPPQAGYPVNQHKSHLLDPYSEFSYQDSPHLYGSNMPPSGQLASDARRQFPGYYDAHINSDGRLNQGQFASSSRQPQHVYYRSPDQYTSSPGGPFYDRQAPTGEVPRNVPPDSRYMHPNIPHVQSQGARPAAPYEPRTELQRTYLGHRHHPGPYDQNGHHDHYYDGRQGGYRGYEDQRPAGFEPHRTERGTGRDEPHADEGQGGYRGYEDQRAAGFEQHRTERGIVNGRGERHVDQVLVFSVIVMKLCILECVFIPFGSVNVFFELLQLTFKNEYLKEGNYR